MFNRFVKNKKRVYVCIMDTEKNYLSLFDYYAYAPASLEEFFDMIKGIELTKDEYEKLKLSKDPNYFSKKIP